MAIIKNGFISGTLGELVGYSLRGKQYIRKRPERKAPPTEGELKNQFMLKLVTAWLQPLKDFVRIGFRNYSQSFEGFNAAFSLLHKEALQKDGYESTIDPSKVRVSYGGVELPSSMEVGLSSAGKLVFSWDPTVGAKGNPQDRVMLLAYNIEKQRAVYEVCGKMRHQGSDYLELSSDVPGKYHVYMAFISKDMKKQSESRYLGDVSWNVES